MPDPDIIPVLRIAMASQVLRHPLPDEITGDMSLERDLGIDAIARVWLAICIEDAFDLRLKDEEVHAWICVDDIARSARRRAA